MQLLFSCNKNEINLSLLKQEYSAELRTTSSFAKWIKNENKTLMYQLVDICSCGYKLRQKKLVMDL